jgi:hypothetical protein
MPSDAFLEYLSNRLVGWGAWDERIAGEGSDARESVLFHASRRVLPVWVRGMVDAVLTAR